MITRRMTMDSMGDPAPCSWIKAKLKGEKDCGWRTVEGEFRLEKHPMLMEHDHSSLGKDLMWFVPHGVMRYMRVSNNTTYQEVRASIEVYDSRSKEWYGPYATFKQASDAFEAREREYGQ